MVPLIIGEEMGFHLLETDEDPVPTSIVFVRKCCCVVLDFVACVLRVKNRCLLIALRKLTAVKSPTTANVFMSTPAGCMDYGKRNDSSLYIHKQPIDNNPLINNPILDISS